MSAFKVRMNKEQAAFYTAMTESTSLHLRRICKEFKLSYSQAKSLLQKFNEQKSWDGVFDITVEDSEDVPIPAYVGDTRTYYYVTSKQHHWLKTKLSEKLGGSLLTHLGNLTPEIRTEILSEFKLEFDIEDADLIHKMTVQHLLGMKCHDFSSGSSPTKITSWLQSEVEAGSDPIKLASSYLTSIPDNVEPEDKATAMVAVANFLYEEVQKFLSDD